MKDAYVIESEGGCTRCGAGKRWTLIGPDGLRLLMDADDKTDAEYICKALNKAYEQGRLAALGEQPLAWRCEAISIKYRAGVMVVSGFGDAEVPQEFQCGRPIEVRLT